MIITQLLLSGGSIQCLGLRAWGVKDSSPGILSGFFWAPSWFYQGLSVGVQGEVLVVLRMSLVRIDQASIVTRVVL